MNEPVALLAAMAEEVETLRGAMREVEPLPRGPFTLHRGSLEGRQVLLAECGVGKVNAAAVTHQLLMEGAGALIFTGVAGAVDASLEVGDLVVSRDAVQHDVDVTALGYGLGELPGQPVAWPADGRMRAAAMEAARSALPDVRALEGRVASGDRFVADATATRVLRERFGASCAEMEGAAAAQVCARWSVPWVVIRSISDTADHRASVDFRAFTGLAAGRAEAVVRALLRSMGGRAAADT